MRSFFASFFGTLAALATVTVVLVAGLMLMVGRASLKSEAPAGVKPGAWMVLDLAAPIQDAPLQTEGLENLSEMLGDRHARVLQTRQVTRALQAAAADPEIAGLFLVGRDAAAPRAGGFGGLHEVREAVLAFRAAGKPVKAWLAYAGTREYWLASAASEVILDPYGAVVVPGLAMQPMFFTGAFEKFGIGVQVTRVGRFKSAVEPYTRRDMSPESRAQSEKLLGDLWSEVTRSMEDSRRLPAGSIQKAADTEGMVRAESAKKSGLVDRIAYLDEVLDELKTATGVTAKKDPFKQVTLARYSELVPGDSLLAKRRTGIASAAPSGHEKIAIVYAEGVIVDGSGNEQGVVWGEKVARQIRQLRGDDSVKALVLRVNSPGGSANASEAIQRELKLFQKERPVVVSMGSVAASGGYWIATAAERVFAEPSTITGSIGVFGLLFNVQGLATDRLGLTFDTVKTARFADAATMSRPKTPEELAVIQGSVDWLYGQFLAKVAEARKLEVSAVEAIAEGRVWSGAEALRLGLVDEIGGLDAAVALAAKKASVGEEFAVVEYPERKSFFETLAEGLSRKQPDSTGDAGAGPVGAFVKDAMDSLKTLGEYNDPRGIYARLPFDHALR
jgi:protease-4